MTHDPEAFHSFLLLGDFFYVRHSFGVFNSRFGTGKPFLSDAGYSVGEFDKRSMRPRDNSRTELVRRRL